MYFDLPTRDKNTGLRVTQPGCVTLNGIDALAYVRSRHFSQEINGKWKEDQSSDFGRISRQQDFIRRAATKAFATAKSNPLAVSSLVKAALKSVHPDASLNLTALADRLAALGTSEIATFTLPANPDHVGDAAILRLDQEKATALLSFFGGQPPAPAASTTVAPPSTNAAARRCRRLRARRPREPADGLRAAPDLRADRHRPGPRPRCGSTPSVRTAASRPPRMEAGRRDRAGATSPAALRARWATDRRRS